MPFGCHWVGACLPVFPTLRHSCKKGHRLQDGPHLRGCRKKHKSLEPPRTRRSQRKRKALLCALRVLRGSILFSKIKDTHFYQSRFYGCPFSLYIQTTDIDGSMLSSEDSRIFFGHYDGQNYIIGNQTACLFKNLFGTVRNSIVQTIPPPRHTL